MKLKWIDADSLDKNIKATAHKSGKLGFTKEAADKLQLFKRKAAKVGLNEDDPNDNSLYIAFLDFQYEGTFKVSRAGQYYYINIKPLFDTLKIDYVNDSVVYDIVKENYVINEEPVYKFKRRPIKKTPAKTEGSK